MKMAPTPDREEKGLAECQEMDKQLTDVALANFGDLVEGIWEETFQAVDFFTLLRMRRVSKNWYASVSRDSAPFQRHVVLALTSAHLKKIEHLELEDNFWRFAKNAVSVLMFEKPSGKIRPSDHLNIDAIWEAYEEQVAADGRLSRITSVTYANMSVSSRDLSHLAMGRTDFRTVLYQVPLTFGRKLLFDHICRGHNEEPLIQAVRYSHTPSMTVRVDGKDSFTRLNDNECLDPNWARNFLETFELDNDFWEFGKYFEVNHYSYAEDCGLEYFVLRNVGSLVEGSFENLNKHVEAFPSPVNLRELVKRLLKRFDPDNQKAASSFEQGNLRDFVSEAHPMVSNVLLQLLQEEHNIRSCAEIEANDL